MTGAPVQLGMVGAGRMGAGLVHRLLAAGHHVVVYDVDAAAARRLGRHGAVVARSLAELAARLTPPRAVWVMVPAAVSEATVAAVAAELEPDDLVVDGGNTFWKDDLARAAALRARGIHYLDVGTSGGIAGRERGFCLMIGGEPGPVRRLEPVFTALAPGVAAASPTPQPARRRGRARAASAASPAATTSAASAAATTSAAATAEQGWLHCGPTGAGHFVKMVHNGIEYGLMAAYAEGLNLLAHAGRDLHDAPTPLRRADTADTTGDGDGVGPYRFEFDLAAVTELWRRGSVVSSWLLDLTAAALAEDPALDGFEGRVGDSGEGRWTVEAAIECGVPANVLSSALFARFASQGGGDLGDRVLSAMRSRFGGHAEHRP